MNDFDAIILGAPNHMGGPSWIMKKFVGKLVELNLQVKHVAIFGAYIGKTRVDRTVRKLQKMVQNKLPKLNLILPLGLSVKVRSPRGPIVKCARAKSSRNGHQSLKNPRKIALITD